LTVAGLQREVRTVLLDAGGVLLDLDYAFLQRLIGAKRAPAEPRVEIERLSRLEAIARREIHEQVSRGGRVGDAWRDYFHTILAGVEIPAADQPALIDTLWEAHQRFGLWTTAIEGGPETVRELRRRGLRLGVVSNAEGRVERDLDGAGYAGLFETVVDSHLVGVEKPDPEIFRIALERMGAEPGTTVFVGDLPSVDLAGAEAAGLAGVLVDRHDLYPGIDAPRLRTVGELPGLLDGNPG
jgi:putative hydrolase of the HAD superfamily